MKKETLGTLLAIITAVISGFAIPVNKIFVVDLNPLVFTAVRALIIGIVFLLLSFFGAKSRLKDIKKLKWGHLILIGVIGGALAFFLFFSGLSLTTSGRAAFLHKTLPVWVVVFAFYFLNEKVNKKHAYAFLLMLVGIIFIFSASISPSDFWLNPSIGDLFVLAATIFWAAENVIARHAMIKGETNLIVSFARMFIGAIVLFAIIVLTNQIGLLLALQPYQVFNLLVSSAILFAFVFCYYWSIKLINVSKASSLLLLAPVISLIIGAAAFGEPLPALQLLGSALILIGAYFVAKTKSMLSTGI